MVSFPKQNTPSDFGRGYRVWSPKPLVEASDSGIGLFGARALREMTG